MRKDKLRFRQVHLDYHTSGDIIPIAQDFDATDFAKTLKDAHVNSVTCFARCHHGYLYYDSKNFPELVHPGLKEKNLLEKQIKSCHALDIKVPVYTTIQWDYYTSKNYPQWACMSADGCLIGNNVNVYKPGFYQTLCVNTPYRDFIKKHIADIFESVGIVEGFFLDIVNIVDCSCKHCVDDMLKQGYNPEITSERVEFAHKMIAGFKKEISAHIRSFNKDALIYYNSAHVSPYVVESKDDYSHWEIESLPSGGWGYTHFPNNVRYAITTGHDILSHTGKFHTSWGDFHSFKNLASLQYEVFRMLAYNVKCLIGDQLEPDGAMSKPVYDLIGKVYEEVEKKEAWCSNAEPVVDIGVISLEESSVGFDVTTRIPDYINGLSAMLDELALQFNIITKDDDLSKYKLLILPDAIFVDDELAKKISKCIENGTKVLATHNSGLNEEETSFNIKELGLNFISEAPYYYDFFMPNDKIGKNLPKTEHVMYSPEATKESKKSSSGAPHSDLQKRYMVANVVECQNDSWVIADTYMPYFNRTWKHFCSHAHTPSNHEKCYPAAVATTNTIYFSHPIFTIYNNLHPKWCKEFIKDAIDILLPNPLLKHNGPSTIITTINKQEEHNRFIIHVLHYIPEYKTKAILTIEDVIPLYNIEYRVYVDKEIKSIKLVPDNKSIDFNVVDGAIVFTIDKINGHAMIELSY